MDVDVKLGDLRIEVPQFYKSMIGNYTTINELFEIVDDLVYQKNKLQEEFDDYKQNVEDNYRPYSPAELYGITDEDFYEDR